jgi:hypothetical protein
VEINIGGDTIVVKGISSTQQESLIAAWIDRNSE